MPNHNKMAPPDTGLLHLHGSNAAAAAAKHVKRKQSADISAAPSSTLSALPVTCEHSVAELLSIEQQHQQDLLNGFAEQQPTVIRVQHNTAGQLTGSSLWQNSGDDSSLRIAAEPFEGNVEYKYKIVGKSTQRYEQLVTQLKWRLTEGDGQCLYELGVKDDGTAVGLSESDYKQSLGTLQRMATDLNCTTQITHEARGTTGGKVCEVLVTRNAGEASATQQQSTDSDVDEVEDIRIGVVGDSDSGKSTLVGVLTSNEYDDGQGAARMNVFRHRHEVESGGRTSAVSRQVLGFDSSGSIVNYNVSNVGWNDSLAEVVEQSSRIITFLDLPAHHSFLKTTILSLVGQHPDFSMLVVSAERGVTTTMKEILGLTVALELPIIVAVTKTDLVTDGAANSDDTTELNDAKSSDDASSKLDATIAAISRILRSSALKKTPFVIRSNDDVKQCVQQMTQTKPQSVTPICMLSSTTGAGYAPLKHLLAKLPQPNSWKRYISEPALFSIDESFDVHDVGTVVSGTVLRGTVCVNDQLLLGPTDDGQFNAVHVSSIHVHKRSVSHANAGHATTIALRQVEQKTIRRGQVLVHADRKPRACVGFDTRIQLLNHPIDSYIQANYQPVLHLSTITQSARIASITEDHHYGLTSSPMLSTAAAHTSPPSISPLPSPTSSPSAAIRVGDEAFARFDFCFSPEYVEVGSRFVFREAAVKGIGKVLALHYYDDAVRELERESDGRSDSPVELSLPSRVRKQRKYSSNNNDRSRRRVNLSSSPNALKALTSSTPLPTSTSASPTATSATVSSNSAPGRSLLTTSSSDWSLSAYSASAASQHD